MMKYFERRGDWERYCDAQKKSWQVLRSFADTRLDEAEGYMRWGDREEGVQRLLWVGANTRPDGSNVELMERLLAMAPPGMGGEASDRWLRTWLDWSLARCVRENSCPLSQASLLRLISLNRGLEQHERAAALMIASSLRDAEAIERNHLKASRGRLGPEWVPYMLSKARLLVAAGEASEAFDVLSDIRRLGHDSVLYWHTHLQAARAAGDLAEASRAESWLATLAKRRWTAEDWRLEGRQARLELYPAEVAAGLALRIHVGSSGQGTLELAWDGSVIEVLPSTDGREIELTLPITVGTHLLEIRSQAGAATATAEVGLLPPAP